MTVQESLPHFNTSLISQMIPSSKLKTSWAIHSSSYPDHAKEVYWQTQGQNKHISCLLEQLKLSFQSTQY